MAEVNLGLAQTLETVLFPEFQATSTIAMIYIFCIEKCLLLKKTVKLQVTAKDVTDKIESTKQLRW